MGCFTACFGPSNHRRLPKSQNKTASSGDQRHEKCKPVQSTKFIQEANILNSIKPISESKDKNEDPLNSSIRKKVTFDLNVKTYEDVSIQEVGNCSVEIEKEKEREKEVKEENGNQNQTLSDSSTSSMISYPPMHRYHNCISNDDYYEDMDLEYSDANDDDNHILVQEESSESLFSLSIESRKQVNTLEIDSKEVNSPIPIRSSCEREMKSVGSNYVRSVLNPVENLSQLKAVKVRTTLPLEDQGKENINFEQELNVRFSEEPSFKRSNPNSKKSTSHLKTQDNEIAVDTSLSSWLVESEKTPISKESSSSIGNSSPQRANSFRSFEDRPILGALTIEELKELSVSTSPRRSPSRSPDEMPIIGTVGSYWSHTGQTMDSDSSSNGILGTSSKFREDKSVKCNSTPSESRLERSLDRGIA